MYEEYRYTDAEIHEGERLLAEILADLAERRALPPVSPPMSDPLDYMRGDNIQALIVQRRGRGWVAEVLFRDVPEGCPECYGTADAWPFWTRRGATRGGKKLVRRLLKAPVPAELVARKMLHQAEHRLSMLRRNQAIVSAYRA